MALNYTAQTNESREPLFKGLKAVSAALGAAGEPSVNASAGESSLSRTGERCSRRHSPWAACPAETRQTSKQDVLEIQAASRSRSGHPSYKFYVKVCEASDKTAGGGCKHIINQGSPLCWAVAVPGTSWWSRLLGRWSCQAGASATTSWVRCSSLGSCWSQAVVRAARAARAGRGWQPRSPRREHQPGSFLTIVRNNLRESLANEIKRRETQLQKVCPGQKMS